jgi:hypothetical protein
MNDRLSCCQESPERAEKDTLRGEMAAGPRQGDDDREKTCFKAAWENLDSIVATSKSADNHLSVNVRKSASLLRYGFILKRPPNSHKAQFLAPNKPIGSRRIAKKIRS